MNKLKFLNLLFLLFISITISAQNGEISKENWQVFQPKGEEFTISTPILLEPFVYNENAENRRFTASIKGRYLFISSDLLTEPFHYNKVKDLLNLTTFKSKKEKLNNFEVEKISFNYSDDFFHKMWIIKTQQRIYIFHTASVVENDKITDRFFKSIKIDRKLTDDNENTEFTFREGIGIDTGASANSGISAVSLKPVDSNNSPLQIRFKPKANYTDFARFFDIQGSVTVRTTFLDTGAVGDVSAITKLPFGLTKNALEAAKKMKFQPMVKNGKAISVTKTVQYTFTIY
jgi:TonB family protein